MLGAKDELSDECLSTGKSREDREVHWKHNFDPLYVEVKHPSTAILLLECREKPILLAAAAALSEFATKSQENLECLFDLDIVESIIPLLEHDDLFTRRFAAKLLAEMTAKPCVRHYLLESDKYIPYFAKILIDEPDKFMQEFSSLILAQLSRDTYGTVQLLRQCQDMNFLFARIQSSDPDIQKNSIEIVLNLTNDLSGARDIINSKDFDFSLIYRLFEGRYPEIQRLALAVVASLVTRNKDEYMQDLFRRSNGLEALLRFLDNDETRDLHVEVLKVLALASDNVKTVQLLDDVGGIRRIFMYLEDELNQDLLLEAFRVVVRLADTPRGKKTLHSCGIVNYLLNTLQKSTQQDGFEITCRGIGKMLHYAPAAAEITVANPVGNILNILKDEKLKWSVRHAAAFALTELLKSDSNSCKNFLDIEGQHYLLWLLKQPRRTALLEVQLMAVEVLNTIARYPTLRSSLISVDMIDAMCTSFEWTCRSTDELKIASCSTLSTIAIEDSGRDAFLKAHGPSKLYNLLSDVESIPVRNAAAQLVQLLSVDPFLANAFTKARYLAYMLNNRASARVIPSWRTCIDNLFNAHLPIKFAFTGRLSLYDVTQDGFYVMRKNTCPFPVLDDFFRFKFCPLESVYVVNTAQSHLAVSSAGDLTDIGVEEAKAAIRRDSAAQGVFLSSECVNGLLDLKFGRLQPDPDLHEYVELFKCKLVATEPRDVATNDLTGLVNINYVVSRAKMLAKFVVRQMSGPDPSPFCTDHQLEIHLKEIKSRIETSVIPLGLLRLGSYLERALLFKVIADKICLPAALVRGEYGKAWIEIALPQIEEPPEETSFNAYLVEDAPCADFIIKRASLFKRQILISASDTISTRSAQQRADQNSDKVVVPSDHRQSVFPTKLLKPNFIVDLMDNPGDLIPIDSERARHYCDEQLTYETVCCEKYPF